MGRFLFLLFCQFVESGPAVIYRFNYEWQVYLSPWRSCYPVSSRARFISSYSRKWSFPRLSDLPKKKALQTCDLFIRKIHPVVSKTPAEKGMELDGIEAVRLFKLLDADGNGAIEIDEQLYCKGFWQLTNIAHRIYTWVSHYNNFLP